MTIKGKIIKGIAGFYYVHTLEGVYECKAKGVFRNQKIKPLVGDDVELEILQGQDKKGNIHAILPRKNALIRPAVANVDQALVIFAMSQPEPNFNLLDRFLVMMEAQNLPTKICFNKSDLESDFNRKEVIEHYRNAGYHVIETSTKQKKGVDEIAHILTDKTTVLAGPSGVGKSSMVNLVSNGFRMDTGSVSEKIGRGRHTTRHSEIFCIKDETYIVDTPGFSSLMVMDMEPAQLRFHFPEFEKYEGTCKFHGCVHIHEPACSLKEALERGEISLMRYEHYKQFFEELSNKKKY